MLTYRYKNPISKSTHFICKSRPFKSLGYSFYYFENLNTLKYFITIGLKIVFHYPAVVKDSSKLNRSSNEAFQFEFMIFFLFSFRILIPKYVQKGDIISHKRK